MGMRSNDDRFFQTHTKVPFLDKEITGNTINIPTEVSCIVPFIFRVVAIPIFLVEERSDPLCRCYKI